MTDEHVSSPQEIWARVFEIVRRNVDVPTVWLAMQAVTPLVVEGARFVAALPADMSYLSVNLESNESASEIEAALQSIMGRPMMFTLIEGETIHDWKAQKASLAAPAESALVFLPDTAESSPTGSARQQLPSNANVMTSWDDTYDCIAYAFKHTSLMRYAHGQAQFLLNSVHVISDTMDVLLPTNDPADLVNQRSLSKMVEKLGGLLSLDALFVAMEIVRYRQGQGKDFEDFTRNFVPKE